MGMIQEPVRCTDPGFFGPDSISWRVSGPTIAPALVYAGVMFFLSPQNIAIGIQNSDILNNPLDRGKQTGEYMFAIYYGDRATATHAAAMVNAIHDHVKGTWAPTGDRVHVASEPHNLMWLLVPVSQGLLDAYDAYGPGRRLTLEERDWFWRDEVTIVAELNRIPLDLVPKSQAEADAYFEEQRPYLAMTEPATVLNNFFPSFIWGGTLLPAPAALPVRLALAAGIALLPDYAMLLLGQRPYPRPVKLAIRAANRPLFASIGATPILRDMFPMTTSSACRALVRRARTAARTGHYDPPVQVDVDQHLALST